MNILHFLINRMCCTCLCHGEQYLICLINLLPPRWRFFYKIGRNMKLYNTLTRKKEKIVPIKPREIGLYACGPTVYDYTHLGHLRKYMMDDILVRALRYGGYKVRHVQNITDVGHLTSDDDIGEDKLEKGAKKYNQSVYEIAQKFEDFFYKSLDKINCTRPNVTCRATENIPEQIEMVKQLEKKGYTYEIDGDGIYFDTSKLKDYGKLANLKLDKLKAGARVDVEGKKNPTDFALWKFEKKGVNRAMAWKSPWNERSFPGWHIECSAMSMKYLGDQFDIHTGGIDHINVHHTNEIAQSEACTNKKPFVKYWVHHNFLLVEGEKMSKSAGNFYTIEDILDKGYEPQALRLLFLMSHYRSEQNFTWSNLTGTNKSWQKIVNIIITWKRRLKDTKDNIAENDSKLRDKYKMDFFKFINDDLSTPQALVVFWDVIKDKELSFISKYRLLLEFDGILGLGIAKISFEDGSVVYDIPDKVRILLEKRREARVNNDWKQSDYLRDRIAEFGYKVLDEESGTQLVNKIN